MTHNRHFQLLRKAADRQEEGKREMVRRLQESCISGDVSAIRSVLSAMPDPAVVSATVNYCPSGSTTLLFKVRH